MRAKTRFACIVLIVLVNLGICNSLADIIDLDEGSRTALGMIREVLGEGEYSTLGAAGTRIYLTENGIDIDKVSLDIEIYLGGVIVYAKRNDGFWDACTWFNVSEEKLALLQGRFLKVYDKINDLCTNNLNMVIGITGEETGYSIETSEIARLLYEKYFANDPRISDVRPHLAGYINRKTSENSDLDGERTRSLINSVSHSFSIRNGIKFGDTKNSVKEKEVFKIAQENSTTMQTVLGKVAGVENSFVEYHFNDNGLLYDIYMDFGVNIGNNSQAEVAYNSIYNTLCKKYGASIILDDETWYVINGSAVTKYRDNSTFLKSVNIKPLLQQYSQWIVRYDDINVMIDLLRYAPNGEGSTDVVLSYRAFTNDEEVIAKGRSANQGSLNYRKNNEEVKTNAKMSGDLIFQLLSNESVTSSSDILVSWEQLDSVIDENYSLFLINTNNSSYFVICKKSDNTITAIKFNRMMTARGDLGQINSMYATILTLQDNIGDVAVNHNNLNRNDIAKYLDEFYDYWKN